jgi:tetratricopeptide (TPR) repeat protein
MKNIQRRLRRLIENIDRANFREALSQIDAILQESLLGIASRAALIFAKANILHEMSAISHSLSTFREARRLYSIASNASMEVVCLFEEGQLSVKLAEPIKAWELYARALEILELVDSGAGIYGDNGISLDVRALTNKPFLSPEVDPVEARGRLLLARANAARLSGQPERSVVDLSAVIEDEGIANEIRAGALLDRGVVLFEIGKLGSSIADLEAIVHLEGAGERQKCDALFNLASINLELGKLELAATYGSRFLSSPLPSGSLKDRLSAVFAECGASLGPGEGEGKGVEGKGVRGIKKKKDARRA